jgi:hypothetical protein
MSKEINVSIWGRTFKLNIVYQNYPGEEVTENQRVITEEIRMVSFDDSLDKAKDYIKKYNAGDISEGCIDNIFKYVIPKCILIPRENDGRIFAVMCDYRFDMEHGLALIYENKRFKAIGKQDIIL